MGIDNIEELFRVPTKKKPDQDDIAPDGDDPGDKLSTSLDPLVTTSDIEPDEVDHPHPEEEE